MCPLQNLAGVDVDDPVAPSPAAAIGDATVSSVDHRPSSIVAPNRDQTISLNRKRRRRPASQHHTAGSRRSSSSIPCYCRRSPSRARVRTAIKVNGASFLLMVQRRPRRARSQAYYVPAAEFGRR